MQITDHEYAVIKVTLDEVDTLLPIENATPGQTILVNLDARGSDQISLKDFDLRAKNGNTTIYYHNATQLKSTKRDLGVDFILNIYDSTQPDNQWHPSSSGTASISGFYGYLLAPYGNISIGKVSKGTLIANNVDAYSHYKGVVTGTVVPASDFEEYNVSLEYSQNGATADFVIKNGDKEYTAANKTSGSGTTDDPYVWQIVSYKGTNYDFILTSSDVEYYGKKDTIPTNHSGAISGNDSIQFSTDYARNKHTVTVKYSESGTTSNSVVRYGNNALDKKDASGDGSKETPYVWTMTVNEGDDYSFILENTDVSHYNLKSTNSGNTTGKVLADTEVIFTNEYVKIHHTVNLKYYQEGGTQDNFVIRNGNNSYIKSNASSGSGTKADPYIWKIDLEEGDNYDFKLSNTDLSTYDKQDTAPNNAKAELSKDETVEFSTKYTKRIHTLAVKYVETGAKSNFVLTNNGTELKKSDAKGSGTSADPYIWTLKLDENASYDIKISADDVEHYNKAQKISGDTKGNIFSDVEVTITNDFTPKQYTVTFKSGDHGTFGDIKVTKPYGEVLSAPSTEALKAEDYYDFIGWDKELAKTVSGDDTYVAQWKRRTHVITLRYVDPTGDGNFTITNGSQTYDKTNKTSGSGTEDDPYVWEVEYLEGEEYNFALNTPSREGYELSENPNISTTGTVEKDFVFEYTPKYTPKTYKLTLRKSFAGIEALASDYKITSDFNQAEFTVSNAVSGTGSTDDPYIWELEVPYDTEVSFFESEPAITGYILTQKVDDKESDRGLIKIKTNGNELSFVSNYEKVAESQPNPTPESELEDKSGDMSEKTPTIPSTLDNIISYLSLGLISIIIGAFATNKAVKYRK